VSCAVVLERLQPDWRLDAAQSTRRNLKFRRGPGKVLIVNHDGCGWWDPLSVAKGGIFSLAQYLDPNLDFPASCRVLRELAGFTPTLPSVLRVKRLTVPAIPIARRWERRAHLSPGSSTWPSLTRVACQYRSSGPLQWPMLCAKVLGEAHGLPPGCGGPSHRNRNAWA
jgi:hypothetical protein